MANEKRSNAAVAIREALGCDLVTESEAAQILGIAKGTLSVWRSTGRHDLPFIKVGGAVRYSQQALATWLESRTRSNGATA